MSSCFLGFGKRLNSKSRVPQLLCVFLVFYGQMFCVFPDVYQIESKLQRQKMKKVNPKTLQVLNNNFQKICLNKNHQVSPRKIKKHYSQVSKSTNIIYIIFHLYVQFSALFYFTIHTYHNFHPHQLLPNKFEIDF